MSMAIGKRHPIESLDPGVGELEKDVNAMNVLIDCADDCELCAAALNGALSAVEEGDGWVNAASVMKATLRTLHEMHEKIYAVVSIH